jgi:hypothetical protein
MYVRLAFAVAAHLEAEILIIDEVLAVGDAEFNDVARESRAVLFMSHNMGAIGTLTRKCLSSLPATIPACASKTSYPAGAGCGNHWKWLSAVGHALRRQ